MSQQPAVYAPRHVVILAHPDPHSFNALVADTYCATVRERGQEAIVRDLYALGFDPILKDAERPHDQGFTLADDVAAELRIIDGSDAFVFVYPIWFGMPPAMMKGYVDRVLGAGVKVRQVQERSAKTLMRDKRLLSITSSGASKTWLSQQDQMDSLRNVFGRYLLHAFGLKAFENLHFGETIDGLPPEFVDANLRQVTSHAAAMCDALIADAVPAQLAPA